MFSFFSQRAIIIEKSNKIFNIYAHISCIKNIVLRLLKYPNWIFRFWYNLHTWEIATDSQDVNFDRLFFKKGPGQKLVHGHLMGFVWQAVWRRMGRCQCNVIPHNQRNDVHVILGFIYASWAKPGLNLVETWLYCLQVCELEIERMILGWYSKHWAAEHTDSAHRATRDREDSGTQNLDPTSTSFYYYTGRSATLAAVIFVFDSCVELSCSKEFTISRYLA